MNVFNLDFLLAHFIWKAIFFLIFLLLNIKKKHGQSIEVLARIETIVSTISFGFEKPINAEYIETQANGNHVTIKQTFKKENNFNNINKWLKWIINEI